jgi:FeS assembly SUF system protein
MTANLQPTQTPAPAPEPAPTTDSSGPALTAEQIEALRPRIIDAIRTVYDPEIPVNIYELGLIYDLDIDAKGNVAIRMTLTAPGCPVAGTMPQMVRDAVARVEGLNDVDVDLVWDPPWDKSRMSEAAQLELGMY